MQTAGPVIGDGRSGVEQPIRAAELVAALSIATDLGTGQPLEHAMRTAVLAVRLGELAGASAEELSDTYYVALLHASGLHVERARGGAAVRRRHRAPGGVLPRRSDQPGGGARVLSLQRRARPAPGGPREDDRDGDRAARPRGPARRSRRCARSRSASPAGSACARASRRRWSTSSRAGTGAGFPAVAGEAIPLPMRLLHVARDASLFLSAAGPENGARGHRASAPARPTSRASPSSPCANLDEMLAELDETRMWEHALDSEPSPPVWLSGERIDAAFGDDRRDHRPEVAVAARALDRRRRAGRGRRLARWGCPSDSVTLVRRAALAHDLGRVGVPNAIWEKPGPLGFGEWERVRLHAHYTERAFAQSPALAPIGRLAGSHHERLDGSGYHRGSARAGPRSGRPHPRRRRLLLGDARGAARTGRRSTRPAAEAELLREAKEGRLDPEAVDAVLGAAGHRVAKRPRELPAGLTPARAGGAARPRARRVEPGDRRRSRHLREDRRAPRPAHLREGRRPQPRGRDALGLRAGPRSHAHRAFARCGRAGRGRDTRLDIGAERRRRDTEGGKR